MRWNYNRFRLHTYSFASFVTGLYFVNQRNTVGMLRVNYEL